jgi:hypothetical protein
VKNTLDLLAHDYTDRPSKLRIKELCDLASREMERNKRIMGEFVNRASGSPSNLRDSSLNAYRRSRTEFGGNLPAAAGNKLKAVEERESSYMMSDDQLSDIKVEQRMLAERTALLKQLEEKNNKINDVINHMASIVGGEQHDMVEAIGDNLQNVRANVSQDCRGRTNSIQ